jgi:hypothetical protein
MAGSALQWNHTTAAGRTGMCVALYTYNGGGVTVSGVTYNAVAFTKKTNSATIGIGTNTEIYCSDGITPASGTNQVSINMSGTGGYVSAWAISVTGGNVGTPLSNFNSATGTSAAPSITATSGTGQLIFDIVGNDSGDSSITQAGGQTLRMSPTAAGAAVAAGSTKPGAASTTMSWTLGGSEAWAQSYGSFQ